MEAASPKERRALDDELAGLVGRLDLLPDPREDRAEFIRAEQLRSHARDVNGEWTRPGRRVEAVALSYRRRVPTLTAPYRKGT